MSKKKSSKSKYNKKKKANRVVSFLKRFATGSTNDKKLSEIIKEMALKLLRKPYATMSGPASQAVLMLAAAAWNSAVGDDGPREQHIEDIKKIDWEDVKPWAELRSKDTNKLIDELVKYKLANYAHDYRHILTIETTAKATLRITWDEVSNIDNVKFPKTNTKVIISKEKPS